MAAPVPTARQMPTGGALKLPEGFKAEITFASVPNISLWEKDVEQPGFDGGEPIDTTTQLNAAWKTFQFRQLIDLSEVEVVCAYDPDVISTLIARLNKNDTVTITHPLRGSTFCFYGGFHKVKFAAFKIGEFPLVTLSVKATNWDPVNQVEAGPVLTPGTGT
jgi:hypothetical protein